MKKVFCCLIICAICIGCSKSTPCQKTYAKLVKCFPSGFDGGDNEKENFMFACKKGEFGECYDAGDCGTVLKCVSVGTELLRLKISMGRK